MFGRAAGKPLKRSLAAPYLRDVTPLASVARPKRFGAVLPNRSERGGLSDPFDGVLGRAARLLLLTLLLVCGCGSCRGERPGTAQAEATVEEEPSRESEVEASARRVGVVRGRVRLADGAALPTYPPQALQGAGPAAELPRECQGTDPMAARQPVTLSEGGLMDVMVTATGDRERFFAALGSWEPQEREVRIRGCRLQPPLVTATRGDTLVLSNESDYPFMLAVGRSSFMEGLLKGSPKRIDLDEGGVQAIRCGFAAPCGRTDVVVVYHPVHTVTGAGGRFELEVPANQNVEIHAWHPLFQDTTVTVAVPQGETREVELVLTPALDGAAQPERSGEDESGATGESASDGHAEETSAGLF